MYFSNVVTPEGTRVPRPPFLANFPFMWTLNSLMWSQYWLSCQLWGNTVAIQWKMPRRITGHEQERQAMLLLPVSQSLTALEKHC